MDEPSTTRYRPIEDYALIGDCHGSALVSTDGSIDWAALNRFDADPVFCRVLDANRGGFWSIRPTGAYTKARAYLPGTNVLRTVFTTAQGSVSVTDFMPVGRRLDARVHDYVHLSAPGWIVRRIEGLQGAVELAIGYRPSQEFARVPVVLRRGERAGHAVQAGVEMAALYVDRDLDFVLAGDLATATLRISAGEHNDFVLADNVVEGESPCMRAAEFLQATQAF